MTARIIAGKPVTILTTCHYRAGYGRPAEWSAVTSEYDGPEAPMGTGHSEDEAVEELVEKLTERAERAAKLILVRS